MICHSDTTRRSGPISFLKAPLLKSVQTFCFLRLPWSLMTHFGRVGLVKVYISTIEKMHVHLIISLRRLGNFNPYKIFAYSPLCSWERISKFWGLTIVIREIKLIFFVLIKATRAIGEYMIRKEHTAGSNSFFIITRWLVSLLASVACEQLNWLPLHLFVIFLFLLTLHPFTLEWFF